MISGKLTGMRLSELSKTISTKADTTWWPAPSCSFFAERINHHQVPEKKKQREGKNKECIHGEEHACLHCAGFERDH